MPPEANQTNQPVKLGEAPACDHRIGPRGASSVKPPLADNIAEPANSCRRAAGTDICIAWCRKVLAAIQQTIHS
jgi:hypothetical protein